VGEQGFARNLELFAEMPAKSLMLVEKWSQLDRSSAIFSIARSDR
jgi:hypothetical protein